MNISDTVNLNNAALFAVIVAFLLPVFQAAIQRPKWTQQVKSSLTFVVCLAFSSGTVFFAGNWSSTDLVRTFLVVFVIAQVSYRQFWKPSGITTKVENLTSPPSARIASNTDLGERVRRV